MHFEVPTFESIFGEQKFEWVIGESISKHREQERISMDKVLVGRKSVLEAKVQFQLRSKILFFLSYRIIITKRTFQ